MGALVCLVPGRRGDWEGFGTLGFGSSLLNGSGVKADAVAEGNSGVIDCQAIQNRTFNRGCTI
jgi:hypothetical protein